MMNRMSIKRLVSLSSGSYKPPFQFCQKRFPHYYFSQSKKVPPHNPSNPNPSPQPQPKTKPRTARQRLIQLKQQKRQQQYQRKLQQINVTTGNFNAFTQYLMLEKQKWIYILVGAFAICLLVEEESPFCYKTMGIVKDPFTGRKKFMVVNEYRQRTLEKTIIEIFEKQITFWTQEEMKGDISLINKALQKKLENALDNLNKKYGIEFKQFPKQQANYQIAQSGQTIVASVLGQDKLVISTKLLRLSPQAIQNLILLMHSLHSRYLHVQNISFWERTKLTPSLDTKKVIKVEKTFISNTYSAQGIQDTIELMAERYAKDEDTRIALKENIEKALKQLFAIKNASKSLAQFDLRSRLKNVSQFIL